VYQHHGLVPSLSVLHNVLLGRLGAMSGFRSLTRLLYVPAEQVRAVAESLEELGVQVPLSRRASDLSGGQQQRVAVARALWQNPQLLLADEPVASVDAETAESILNALKERNEHNDLTVLVSLHQRDLVMRFCSRVVVLDDGGVVYDGPPGELDRHPMGSLDTSYAVEESTVVRA
jgi:phosphonate transport system ATP-binding protein